MDLGQICRCQDLLTLKSFISIEQVQLSYLGESKISWLLPFKAKSVVSLEGRERRLSPTKEGNKNELKGGSELSGILEWSHWSLVCVRKQCIILTERNRTNDVILILSFLIPAKFHFYWSTIDGWNHFSQGVARHQRSLNFSIPLKLTPHNKGLNSLRYKWKQGNASGSRLWSWVASVMALLQSIPKKQIN